MQGLIKVLIGSAVSQHSEFTEYLEFVLFRIIQKLQKNDAKIEFFFPRKTRSDSNADLNIRLRVRYAGP